MTDEIQKLLDQNKAWAAAMKEEDPEFFARLADQQAPKYLWIGCSDSRVPANQITGLLPGEVFVHRNVANVVMQTDINCMSVIEFAIRVIKVRHIIVCGHYGCAGVKAAMHNSADGVIGAWISGIRKLWSDHKAELSQLEESDALAKLCEYNVRRQVKSVCSTTVLQDTWDQGGEVDVHGWIYSVGDGIIKDLGYGIAAREDVARLEAD
ncbi:MAG: carbonate dehydratase [Gammaproteobacteria bacterium]